MKAGIGVVGQSCLIGPIVICTYAENGEYNVIKIPIKVIDKTNICRSVVKGMTESVNSNWTKKIKLIYIDEMMGPTVLTPIKHAGNSSLKIHVLAEAKRIAKEVHEEIILNYDKRFPELDFKNNKGEATREHKRMIRDKKGGTPVHRRSFDPMRRYHIATNMRLDKGIIGQRY
jgi:ribonuclease HII